MTATTGPELRCPQCGAPLPVADDAFATCASCRASLWIDLRGVVPHLLVKPRLGPGEARGAVEKYLVACEVDRPPVDMETRLAFHPWWVVEEDGRERLVAAAVASAFGAPPRAADASGVAVPFRREDAGTAEVVAPSVAAEDAAGGTGGRVVRLVHVPVCAVTFRHGQRRWTATVDAVTGAVDAVALPPASTRRIDAGAITLFCLSMIVFAVEAAVVRGFWWTLLAFAVTAAVVVGGVQAYERTIVAGRR